MTRRSYNVQTTWMLFILNILIEIGSVRFLKIKSVELGKPIISLKCIVYNTRLW